MREKLYRVRLSQTLDQEIIGFLESVPQTRRNELLRHILRYYVSQLEPNGELFIVSDRQQTVHFSSPEHQHQEGTKEYKLRLDEVLDKNLVETLERIPKKRRSEFWRYVLLYYLSHLHEGEFFVMPTKLVFASNTAESKPQEVSIEEENVGEEPGDLSMFTF